MNVSAPQTSGLKIPFDHQRLDRLMDEAGIDVVIATSKHNVQYLLGGHRADFFDYMDATGVTRYLPVFVYPKGKPEKAAYIGHRLEKFQRENNPMWTPETQTTTAGSVDAMQKAVDYFRKAGIKPKRIAAEFGFLPYDASVVLRNAFPDAEWVDALFVLERQRAKKSADELAKLKLASEAVLASQIRNGRRATSCRSTPAAIITAISATSAAWRSRVSPTPSLSICWRRSKPSSARGSRRREPAPWVARFMPLRNRYAPSRSTTIISISWRTAWAWSVTKRRASPATARCLIRPNTPISRWNPAWWCR